MVFFNMSRPIDISTYDTQNEKKSNDDNGRSMDEMKMKHYNEL